MKKVHLVIADLFLPQELGAATGLALPYLEKLLARGKSAALPAVPIEDLLCGMFGVAAAAQVSARFDALGEGCWMRADPVHLRLQREQVVLLPNVALDDDEARQFCASLSEHFAADGLEFFAPHPERWYVRFRELPDVRTAPLSQAAGRNIHGHLPSGPDARLLQKTFNEAQMLLHAHRLNEAREARNALPVNGLWFWGGGPGPGTAQCDFGAASSDDMLVQMLAASAEIPFVPWQDAWRLDADLLVWGGLRSALKRGDLDAWRAALQAFESGYAKPLWHALQSGKIASLEIDILGADGMRRVNLKRADAFAFWRRSRRLSGYSA